MKRNVQALDALVGKVIEENTNAQAEAGIIVVRRECLVRDDGQGIPADRLASVFDKYETDPRKEGGEGLGLAIVKSFVEAHGGTVNVESEPGAGSAFRFTLPARPR